jgi:hypothetical protein
MTAHQLIKWRPVCCFVVVILDQCAAVAQQSDTAAASPRDESASTLELARKTQNLIADLISLLQQNNLNFGYGAKDAPHSSSTQYVLNIQPVVPVKVTDELDLITRPIIPVVRQPDLVDGADTWRLADILLQTYLSPSKWDKPIFGIGPVFQFPSTTNGEGRHREVERRAIRRPGGATRPVRDRRPRAAPMVVRWRQLSPGR